MTKTQHWKQQLLEQVRGANRLVVWDYHYVPDADMPDSEKRVPHSEFETRDRDEIRQFLDRIEIDEAASGGHCMCLGSPHFDFYVGERDVASLSLHHGLRMRWTDHWKGDAELTRSSSFALCNWLKDRGIEDPWRELQGEVDRSLAYQRRVMAVRDILPASLCDSFLRADDEESVVELLRNADVEPAELAGWCLQILGCDSSTWELFDRVTHAHALATGVLPRLGRKACSEALRAKILQGADRNATYGAARMLFYFGGWESFEPGVLNDALPFVIRVSIQHPRPRNRQYVMYVISRIEGGEVPLRWVLNGEVTPEELDLHETTEPAGAVFARGLDKNEPLHACDRAYAAWLLGNMGVREARPTIEDLARGAKSLDKEVFERALKKLEGQG